MADFENLTKTAARFKLIETAAIADNAPAFGVGQLIVDDNGNLSYDPSTGTTVGNRIPIVAKGVANGLATLDTNGKIPTGQLPANILGAVTYKGTWNATTGEDSTGTTIPAAAEDNKGFYYITATAGTWPAEDGISYEVGDWLISDGTTWSKVDTSDAVTSVNGKTGTVVIGIGDIEGLQAAIDAAKVKADGVSTSVDGTTVSILGAAAATEGQILRKGATTVEWVTPEEAETPTLQEVVTKGNTVTAGTATQTVTAGALEFADTTGNKAFKVDVTNSTVTGDDALKTAFQEWMDMGAVYRVTAE